MVKEMTENSDRFLARFSAYRMKKTFTLAVLKAYSQYSVT